MLLEYIRKSPHCDDAVFGCGGTIEKHFKAGDKVSVLYLNVADKVIEAEAKAAGKILGFCEQIFCSSDRNRAKVALLLNAFLG